MIRLKKDRIKLLALFIMLLLMTSCVDLNLDSREIETSIDGELKAHFIDIGQGDSSLIELATGETILIDGGPRKSQDKLISYLKKNNIKTIDYMVATHPHEDHIGGLPEVLRNFEVKNVYMPEKTANTKIFEELLREIKKKGLKIKLAKAGDRPIDSGDLVFEFLGPVRTDYHSTNDYSIVSRISYKNTSLMVMGDAEKKAESDIIKRTRNLEADVLRLGHHGSTTSSSEEFLSRVGADYYVISSGKGNSYGHPHREIVDTILYRKGFLYRTDEMGDIVMLSDGSKIEFNKKPVDFKEDKEGYIGNKNSEIYHRESCSKLPGKNNRVYFKSRKEAIESNYRPHNCVK